MAEDLSTDPVFTAAAEFFKDRPEGVLERSDEEVAQMYALPVNVPQEAVQAPAKADPEPESTKPRPRRTKS